MFCEHNRRLSSPCIDCDPLAFFEVKLTEALAQRDPEALRREVTRWRDRASTAIVERE